MCNQRGKNQPCSAAPRLSAAVTLTTACTKISLNLQLRDTQDRSTEPDKVTTFPGKIHKFRLYQNLMHLCEKVSAIPFPDGGVHPLPCLCPSAFPSVSGHCPAVSIHEQELKPKKDDGPSRGLLPEQTSTQNPPCAQTQLPSQYRLPYLDFLSQRIPPLPEQPPARQAVAVVGEVCLIPAPHIDRDHHLRAHGLRNIS